jgi:DNA repair exonuclease SbcCD ATPase subunit
VSDAASFGRFLNDQPSEHRTGRAAVIDMGARLRSLRSERDELEALLQQRDEQIVEREHERDEARKLVDLALDAKVEQQRRADRAEAQLARCREAHRQLAIDFTAAASHLIALGRRDLTSLIECPRCEVQKYDVGSCGLCRNLGWLNENGEALALAESDIQGEER